MKENDHASTSVLNLSNILHSGRPSAIGHDFVEPKEARTIMGLLCRGGEQAVNALALACGKGIVMWCPNNREDLG
eukprot:4468441-Heterocapsa_arctica.AAC.1